MTFETTTEMQEDVQDILELPPKAKRTPTKEQQQSIELAVNNYLLKIDAGAGSGKTSSLTFIADVLPQESLYLSYNKSMAEEASQKFPAHVVCKTVHALAYQYVGSSYQHKLKRPVGRYVNVAGTGSEIAKYYRIPDFAVTQETFVSKNYIGLIIKDTVNKYEQSADDSLEMKHIPVNHIKDIEKRYPEVMISKLKSFIFRIAKMLWDERKDLFSEVLCTHDTYLKLFQLRKEKLTEYKVIYLDEAQDANDVTLDIFLNQDHAKRILVGDERQQIYAWRGAVNALKKISCPSTALTKSFRFGQVIADIANVVLKNSISLSGNETIESKVDLIDNGLINYDKPYTILFRKNLTLIHKAIDLISNGEDVNVNMDLRDFSNMLKSASELYLGNLSKVKHESIIPFSSWSELEEESRHDGSLSKLCKIVVGGECDKVISILHSFHNSPSAKIVLTTAHKAKGLEYDQVILADDFPSNYNNKGKFVGLTEEEENLLYVACTRAKDVLIYNSTVQECLDIYGVKSGNQKESKKC